jgi:hypothetical protein
VHIGSIVVSHAQVHLPSLMQRGLVQVGLGRSSNGSGLLRRSRRYLRGSYRPSI